MIKKNIAKILTLFGYKIEKVKSQGKNMSVHAEINSFLSLDIDFQKNPFIVEGFDIIKSLKINKDAIFTINEILQIEIDNVKYYVNSWEELYILNEIYDEGIYNINFNEDYTLVDIGMNVGITSLYFAKESNCKKIFAYEPFNKTFILGKKNFELNEFSTKIKSFNYGLGFPERNLKIQYSEKYKGSVGINGLANYIDDNSGLQEYEIQLKNVCEEILKIKDQFVGKVIIKIDCEGSEYEILEHLNNENLIALFDVFMIEWHIKGPNFLMKILNDNNYKTVSFNENSKDIGMIYSFK